MDRARWPALVCFVLWAAPLAGQAPHLAARFAEPPDTGRGGASAGRAFFVSAVLPGAGQWLLRQDRWVPYLAVEAWGWLTYLDRRREGERLARQYRDLAWQVARRISEGPRRDGPFEYYEAMSQYRASGAYDRDPLTPEVEPELDPATYNGSVWRLARELFLPPGADTLGPRAPGYERALAYYRAYATTLEFAWEWDATGVDQEAFRELIRRSDEALRAATTALGLLLANHMASAVDAFVVARLRAAGVPAGRLRLRHGILPAGSGARWLGGLVLEVP